MGYMEDYYKSQTAMNNQAMENNKWDSWLKGGALGVSAVNMGLNIGMYGDKKDALKAETRLANARIDDLQQEQAHRTKTRNHNAKVML